MPFEREPTSTTFVDSLMEELYPIKNYDSQYMRWMNLHQERDKTLPEYTNIFHNLCSNMGIKYSKRHLVLKYHNGLHKYIQTKMYSLDISLLGASYQYVVKIK
jgi:hypothetical protein